MHIKSTFGSNTAKSTDIPVSILAFVRAGPHLGIPAEPHTATIVRRTFIRLPDTFPALVSLARTTFRLPLHAALQITTDMLDVCRGDPVQITEDVYGLLRGVLNFLRVEVVEDGDGEEENRNEGQQETGNGLTARSAGTGKIDNIQEEERREGGESLEDTGLDFVDVFPVNGAQRSEQSSPSVVSRVKRPGQGTHVLSTKPATPVLRAPSSTAAAPAPASGSPGPLPPQPALPVVSPEVGLPEDPRFVIYVSGPMVAHEVMVVCSTDRASKVLEVSRAVSWHSKPYFPNSFDLSR
ncbi:hypothetical protein BD779DRAFT_877998 [Infundibulicybe gibba]|nr:hypothetical protein BD779DRAFT_877998 [Infundibulicybe gibba]